MALIICPECNGKVSDMASTCPHCGYPIKTTVNSIGLFDLQLINTVSKVKAIQAIHKITNMPLEDAKKLVDSKNQIIISNISLEKANMYKKELEKDMIEVSIIHHSDLKESPVEQIKKRTCTIQSTKMSDVWIYKYPKNLRFKPSIINYRFWNFVQENRKAVAV